MDPVNSICGDIHGALEPKGHLRSPEVIVYRLRERDHIQPFFAQHMRRLMRSVPPKHYQAVKIQLVVSVFHCLHLVKPVFIRNPHQLKRLPGCAEDRSPHRQNS